MKGIWVTLSAVAVLTTAGCGSAANNNDTAANNNNTAEAANSAGEAAANGNASKTATGEPVKLKLMSNYGSAEISKGDQAFIDQLQKKTNTSLTFDIPPTTGYKERLQLMLASGEYPDLVFFPDTLDPSFRNAVDNGVLIPVNDYIKNDPELMKYTYDASWDALKVNQDDKIYGIPRTSVTRNDQFWVRQDWLKNVGITIPENGEVTIDEFTDILRKFTLNDPDKDGKNDTYGLEMATNTRKTLDPMITGLSGAFNLLGWQKTSGGKYENMDPMYDPANPAYKNILTYMSQLFKEGLVDPDAPTNDTTKMQDNFWKGVAGVFPGFAGQHEYQLNELKKHDPNAELTYVFVKNDQGKVQGGGYATGLWGFWGVTKSAKDPQKAVDLLNAYLTDDMWQVVNDGIEGADYTLENGVKTPITGAPPASIRRNTMRRANDINFFFPLSLKKEERDLMTPWVQKSLDTVVYGLDLGFIPDATKKPAMLDYQNVWDQTLMKIILGQAPVSKFDELLSGWYKAGGEEYVTEMNDFIKKSSAAK